MVESVPVCTVLFANEIGISLSFELANRGNIYYICDHDSFMNRYGFELATEWVTALRLVAMIQ